jgi:mannose-6-phosphate isomerase-like protein (cupin superfamily)
VREHLHPAQSERHEVLDGKLGIHLDGEDRVLEPGDVVLVPAATPHRLFPVGDGKVNALFELVPALRTEEPLETVVRWRRPGRSTATATRSRSSSR